MVFFFFFMLSVPGNEALVRDKRHTLAVPSVYHLQCRATDFFPIPNET